MTTQEQATTTTTGISYTLEGTLLEACGRTTTVACAAGSGRGGRMACSASAAARR